MKLVRNNWNVVLLSLACMGSLIGYNPASSALVVFLLLAYSILDKYFHHSFHDESRKDIVQLKADFAKVKAKQDQSDLKGAFERRSATA